MADLSDVETAIVGLAAGALYPNGVPPAGVSLISAIPVKVYPGWPDPQDLDRDLKPVTGKPGALHVTVYSAKTERNVTRYPREWIETARNTLTYSAAIAGQAITIAGAAPQTFFVQNFAAFINNVPYVYAATAGQSPASIAAGLGAVIAAGVPGTTILGAVITLPAAARIGAVRIGTTGTAVMEVGRTEKQFMISIWADSPANRTAVSQVVDPVLVAQTFLQMPDGTGARIIRQSGMDNDFDQRQGIYRRDLYYSVEFAITIAATWTGITVLQENVGDFNGNAIATLYE